MGHDASQAEIDESKLSISIRDQHLTKLPFIIPSNHPLEHLDISGNQIKDIPINLPYLRFFDYSSNQLNEISTNVERSLLSYCSLTELHLSFNNLHTLPDSFETFQKLTILSLNNNSFTKYNIQISSLINLNLSCNLLTDFSSITHSIKTLNLSFNRFSTLSFSSQQLITLNLSGNDITSLPAKIHFPSLLYLDLSYNKLKSIDNFEKIAPVLNTLSAQFNLIGHFPSKLPSSIAVLLLANNYVTSVPSLDSYESLNSLSLNCNYITKLPLLPHSIIIADFSKNRIDTTETISLPYLPLLPVSYNSLTEVPNISESSITSFQASHNFIQTINAHNFPQIISVIDLSNNQIDSLPDELFSLPDLLQLSVFSNNISEIPTSISSSQLQLLNISDNPIKALPKLPQTLGLLIAHGCQFDAFPDTVAALNNIICIDFSNNQIKTEIPFLPRAESLYFSGNKISKFPQLGENIKEVDFSHNCITTVNLTHAHDELQELDISYNKLKTFNCKVRLNSLFTLKLNNNINLSLDLHFSIFPFLDCLDINKTKVNISASEPSRNIREIIASSFFDSPKNKLYETNASIGYAEMKGKRMEMEDGLIIRQYRDFDIFAVIDGHGGFYTSSLTAFHLPHLIKTFSQKDIATAIKNMNNILREAKVLDGATLTLALRKGNKILTANIGDSRTLIVRKNGSVFPLTYDHKPYERNELESIRNKGSYVSNQRTDGILAISRSLGDFVLKGVSAIPSIYEYELSQDDYRLVLACDGVFDVISNEKVGQIVLTEQSAPVAASKLRNAAYAMQSEDNISVVVVDL